MTQENLSTLNDEFIIHYGGNLHSVEANTFANSIIALAKVIEEISYLKYPDLRVETRIEALSKGSFRPKIKLYAKSISNILKPYIIDKNQTIPILISLFSLFQCNNNQEQKITIGDQEVTINSGSSTIIIPRNIYDDALQVKNNKNIKQAISAHFGVIENDPSIDSFGFIKMLRVFNLGMI